MMNTITYTRTRLLGAGLVALLLGACGGDSGSPPGGDETGLHAVTLRWTQPTTNTDSTKLEDLAGYHIYLQVGTGELTRIDTLNDPTDSDHVIADLADGEYVFSVSAFNGSGKESALLTSAVITLP